MNSKLLSGEEDDGEDRKSELRKYIARRYAEKAGIKRAYLDGKSIAEYLDRTEETTEVDCASKILFRLVLNPNRANRLGNTPIPSFQDSIQSFRKGEENNIILASEYRPYYLTLNPCSIKYGALVLVREQQTIEEILETEFITVNNEVTGESLEVMLRFSDDTGAIVFHNMDGSGATKEEPHWQANLDYFQLESLRREELNSHYGIYTMPDFPGENIVFTGKNKVEKGLHFVRYLDAKRISYNVLIANNDIYVIPIKNEYAGEAFGLARRSRIAGWECVNLAYVALNPEDYKKVKKGRDRGKVRIGDKEVELCVREILKRAFYEKGEIIRRANVILEAN